MEKFNLKEVMALTFAFEVSPLTVSQLIEQSLSDKDIIIATCFLMDIKVTNEMYFAMSKDNLTKFFNGIDGITNNKAAEILDNGIAMFNAKEFGFKSDEFLNAAFDINSELTRKA